MSTQPNNPLHGLTLNQLLNALLEHYGWEGLAQHISINCFKYEPSIKSSLHFLRRTPWARTQVEQLYLRTFCSSQK
ncbi:VF530 family DNA-binding protein [Paenalcaligenes hominis]|uniref:VF530 family protein n=1 Tax=Paenalcaligenes hominis TaxID=643674 RepID=UPI003526714E